MAGQIFGLLQQRPVSILGPQMRQLMAGESGANADVGVVPGDFVAADEPEQTAEPNRPKPTPGFDGNE